MPKYIELEPLIEEITSCKKTIIQCIDDAPRVDAVPVVRCKKCRHYNPSGCANGFGWCEYYNTGATDEHFCSHGERKEVVNNG